MTSSVLGETGEGINRNATSITTHRYWRGQGFVTSWDIMGTMVRKTKNLRDIIYGSPLNVEKSARSNCINNSRKRIKVTKQIYLNPARSYPTPFLRKLTVKGSYRKTIFATIFFIIRVPKTNNLDRFKWIRFLRYKACRVFYSNAVVRFTQTSYPIQSENFN